MTNATPNILKNNVDIPLFILNFLSSFCDRGLIINANKPPIKNGAIYPNVLITTKNSSEYMIKNIIDELEPIRAKRAYYEAHPEIIDKVLIEGTKKAQQTAKEVMKKVKKAMKLNYFE